MSEEREEIRLVVKQAHDAIDGFAEALMANNGLLNHSLEEKTLDAVLQLLNYDHQRPIESLGQKLARLHPSSR